MIEREKLLGEFWTAVMLLETEGEIRNFFKDLLSETEAVMLARRLKIAKLIYQGKSYDIIEKMHRQIHYLLEFCPVYLST